jgi:hypothetical protein
MFGTVFTLHPVGLPPIGKPAQLGPTLRPAA